MRPITDSIRLVRNLSILLLFILLFTTGTLADTDVSGAKLPDSVTLKVVYAVEGAPMHLYRVADFALTGGSFKWYTDKLSYLKNVPEVSLDEDQDWLSTAQTLSNIIAAHPDALPSYEAVVKNGSAEFEPVPAGLYLLESDGHVVGNEIFYSMPMLILLPHDRDNGEWLDSFTVDAKPGVSELTGGRISCSVIKQWKNIPDGMDWPDSVEVELLKDGKKISGGTKTLSKENNWSATWENLDEDGTYTLTENDPLPSFTVTVTKMENHFTVTNTARPTEGGNFPPPETEDESESESESEEPETPMGGGDTPKDDTPENGTPKGGSDIPKENPTGTPTGGGGSVPSAGSVVTGKLLPKTGDDTPIDRWLILLCASGLAMIFFGIRLESRREKR